MGRVHTSPTELSGGFETQHVAWPSRVSGTAWSSVNGAEPHDCKGRIKRPKQEPDVFSFAMFLVRMWLCFHTSHISKQQCLWACSWCSTAALLWWVPLSLLQARWGNALESRIESLFLISSHTLWWEGVCHKTVFHLHSHDTFAIEPSSVSGNENISQFLWVHIHFLLLHP